MYSKIISGFFFNTMYNVDGTLKRKKDSGSMCPFDGLATCPGFTLPYPKDSWDRLQQPP